MGRWAYLLHQQLIFNAGITATNHIPCLDPLPDLHNNKTPYHQPHPSFSFNKSIPVPLYTSQGQTLSISVYTMAVQDQKLEQYLADERFNRVFTYPGGPTEEHSKPISISYADHGYQGTENSQPEKVFLFFGPLLASRMLFVPKDALAKEHGVRIITADRPGFGDTPDVEAEGRLAFWRSNYVLFFPPGCHSCSRHG